MEKKYINEKRYKKVARNDKRKRTVSKDKKKKVVQKVTLENKRLSNKKVVKKNTKKNKKQSKVSKFFVCVVLLLLIATVSRLILKDESSPFIPNIFSKKEVNENIITIGVIENDLSNKYIDNVVIKELDSYAYPKLINITEDYNIEYMLIKNIQKVSNTEYNIELNTEYGINANTVKKSLEEYMDKENIYYANVKNIDNIEILNENSLKILLKDEDDYFAYNMDLPIYISNIIYGLNYSLTEKTEKKRVYTRREKADENLTKQIVVTVVNSLDNAVEKYKEGKIDIFFSNSKRSIQLLGKYEYNITSYRSGKMLFLIGNPNSEMFNRDEVRNAITSGINRDDILNNVFENNVEIIDLPYIYNKTKYQYDIYAADNILLSNGYTKTKGIYTKKENNKKITLSLELLANKDDKAKIEVAEYIKKDLKEIGININIQKLSESGIKEKIKNKNYDLTLCDVALNINPNINFLKSQILSKESLTILFDEIKNANNINLKEQINKVIDVLQNENIFYGIKSDNIYVIYSKDITSIKNVSYMNILKGIMKK